MLFNGIKTDYILFKFQYRFIIKDRKIKYLLFNAFIITLKCYFN